MTKSQQIGLAIAGVVLSVLLSVVAVRLLSSKTFGEYKQTSDHYYDGLYAGNSDQFAVSSTGGVTTTGDGAFSGGTMNVPSASTNATSSIDVGCVQVNATSSATNVKLIFLAVATTTGNGFTLWSYGSCPNL